MSKIISNFYLIRLDGKPVYVGYTNRSIKQRFSEHKRDKDFGDTEPTIDKLGELSYEFTWDMSLIDRYAKEVSNKETKLIMEYGTKDTIWQKGTSGNLGGQTWANVKYFVRTNRDNPKLKALSEEEILSYLETSDKVSRYISNFVGDMNDPVSIYMKHFASTMDDPVAIYMKNFVNNMNDPVSAYMKNFVNNMNDPVSIYMGSFVNTMDDPVALYMKDFVRSMNDPAATYMQSFVAHMEDPVSRYMKNFVNNMNDPASIYMQSFVTHMDDPVAIYMKHFINNMKEPCDN